MISLIMAALLSVTPATLPNALKTAKAGDVIELAPGDYGTMVIGSQNITIKSADPNRRAKFDKIVLNSSKNLTLSGIEVSYAPKPGEPNYGVMIRIGGGSNITLNDMYIHGVVDGNVLPDLNAIDARGVDGLTISNSKFLEINTAVMSNGSRNVTIRNNDIGFIGTDAIEIPGNNGVVIAMNTIHDFRTNPGMHPDGVQCWTTGQTTGCKNVKIIANKFLGSPGREPQGILFGDEARVGGHENIEITGNVFDCTMWHAVYITSQPKNVVIRYNKVTAGPTMTPWIKVDGTAALEGNIAPSYVFNGAYSLPEGNYKS